MADEVLTKYTPEILRERQKLAPEQAKAFGEFGDAVFAEGKIPAKYKQLIAVAAAHVTQCPYCIKGHTKKALEAEASKEEIMEAIWIAIEMRAGASYAHTGIAVEEILSQEED